MSVILSTTVERNVRDAAAREARSNTGPDAVFLTEFEPGDMTRYRLIIGPPGTIRHDVESNQGRWFVAAVMGNGRGPSGHLYPDDHQATLAEAKFDPYTAAVATIWVNEYAKARSRPLVTVPDDHLEVAYEDAQNGGIEMDL